MIFYTITAPLVNGTTYQRTESNSGSFSEVESNSWDGGSHSTSKSGNYEGARGVTINADGGETHTRSNSNLWRAYDSFAGIENGYSDFQTFQSGGGHKIISPDGAYSESGTDNYGGTWIRYSDNPMSYDNGSPVTSATWDIGSYSSGTGAGHVMAGPYAPLDSDGNTIQEAVYTTYTYNGGGYVPVNASLYFWTYISQTTTKTTQVKYIQNTTTTQQKLAKIGTTTTQNIGSSVITLPTTTNAKSWTENNTSYGTATTNEDVTVITTNSGIDSYWKKTAHTIYILGKGETTAFLKANVAINATNGGPTDTAAYDTYSGPTTFTITRAAGTTSQKPVVADTATDTNYQGGEWLTTAMTNRWLYSAASAGVYYFPGYPHHFPLSSSNITIQTGVSESSTTYRRYSYGEGQWGANAPTTTRSIWGQTSVTYSLAGVSWTEGIPTYTQETYMIPIVRSGSASGSGSGSPIDDDGNPISNKDGAGAEANEYGEQANFFVNFQNAGRQNNGGGADAFYGLAYAWGTLGGTTAVPRQSISVNGIVSSESITWPFVSISAGVATPKPFVTVSQKPAISETSSTAANKTEITTRRIWGDEFFKLTSSRNSSTGTSGSTTTPIQAGGAAITSFQLGGAKGFPVNQLAGGWIPAPAMFVIGGIAQTNESTAIISPGEYFNATFTAPKTFSGSSIANTYFMPKAARTFICYPS